MQHLFPLLYDERDGPSRCFSMPPVLKIAQGSMTPYALSAFSARSAHPTISHITLLTGNTGDLNQHAILHIFELCGVTILGHSSWHYSSRISMEYTETYFFMRDLTSVNQEVLARWVPPSAAPLGGSLSTNMISNTHRMPNPGVT